jgi:catechol 2,3-dioxygenase-like lactoylglutathione lyase family enzyme
MVNSMVATFRIETLCPILNVKDVPISRDFYVKKLGFTEADWGTDQFTFLVKDDLSIYLSQGSQGNPGTWIWIGFEGDIHLLYKEFKASGVKIRQPPSNYSWAMELHVEDPDGHVLRFGTEPNANEPFLDSG